MFYAKARRHQERRNTHKHCFHCLFDYSIWLYGVTLQRFAKKYFVSSNSNRQRSLYRNNDRFLEYVEFIFRLDHHHTYTNKIFE